jgi:hypothetical protein
VRRSYDAVAQEYASRFDWGADAGLAGHIEELAARHWRASR